LALRQLFCCFPAFALVFLLVAFLPY
jgi:hypothetical protein